MATVRRCILARLGGAAVCFYTQKRMMTTSIVIFTHCISYCIYMSLYMTFQIIDDTESHYYSGMSNIKAITFFAKPIVVALEHWSCHPEICEFNRPA